MAGAVAVLVTAACSGTSADADRATGSLFAEMGEPLPGLDDDVLEAFERGRLVAARRFTPHDGLGPDSNASFCGGCHEKPTLGGSASRYRDVFVRVEDSQELEVQAQFSARGRAPDHPRTTSVVRSAIPFFGAGLLAEIPSQEILAHADPNDADGDGISGRVNFERGFVARFGRKAQIAGLDEFVRLALFDHLGLTTDPVTPSPITHDAIPLALPTRDTDDVPDPEVSPGALGDLTTFVALLAPPTPATPSALSERGRAEFSAWGCADCHLPALQGPRGPVFAYTDLLLHDLGAQLGDGIELGEASGQEFRTQPLWGLAATGPYLHDGRADTIEEAIEAHGGEALGAREHWDAADAGDRLAVVTFLLGLGGHEHRPDGLLPLDDDGGDVGLPGGPLLSMPTADESRFLRGRALFDHDFALDEGLGPRFNGDACRSCHFDPAIGGAGPAGVDVIRTASTVVHRYDTDGARPAAPRDGALSRRQTPTALGLGLVEQIDDEAILALADPEDANGDGIRGVASILPDGRLGRFGWAAQVPTVEDFARDALGHELGITVPGEGAFGLVDDDDAIADPEISAGELADLVFFMQQLGYPRPAEDTSPQAIRGAEIFAEIGCDACHVPALPTRAGELVPLYSDLLLHEVGGQPLRTPPLWGLRHSAPFMHDGSAPTAREAIVAHAGEATVVVGDFSALDESDQAALLRFLESR